MAQELEETARVLEARSGFPAGYVERARAAARALTPIEGADDDVVPAAHLLQEHAGAALGVPVAATPPRRAVQGVVRRLTDWYLSFLIPRVADTGQAAARFAVAVTERLDRVEARHIATRRELEAEVSALRARVAELEARLGGTRPDHTAGPPRSR